MTVNFKGVVCLYKVTYFENRLGFSTWKKMTTFHTEVIVDFVRLASQKLLDSNTAENKTCLHTVHQRSFS